MKRCHWSRSGVFVNFEHISHCLNVSWRIGSWIWLDRWEVLHFLLLGKDTENTILIEINQFKRFSIFEIVFVGYRQSPRGVLKTFTKCSRPQFRNFIKKETSKHVFLEICEIFRNTFFTEQFRSTAFGVSENYIFRSSTLSDIFEKNLHFVSEAENHTWAKYAWETPWRDASHLMP